MKANRNAWLGAAVVLTLCPTVVVAQQSSQSSPAQATHLTAASAAPQQKAKSAAAKSVRVWTEDDISSVRTPADNYIDVERAQQAAAKQAAVSQPATADPTAPKTLEQADSMIAAKAHDLNGERDYLKRLQEQVKDPTVTGIEKKRLEWRLKSHTVTAQTLQSQVSKLQAERDALAKKSAAGNDSSPTPPQSH